KCQACLRLRAARSRALIRHPPLAAMPPAAEIAGYQRPLLAHLFSCQPGLLRPAIVRDGLSRRHGLPGFSSEEEDAAGAIFRIMWRNEIIEILRPEKRQLCELPGLDRTEKTAGEIVGRPHELRARAADRPRRNAIELPEEISMPALGKAREVIGTF